MAKTLASFSAAANKEDKNKLLMFVYSLNILQSISLRCSLFKMNCFFKMNILTVHIYIPYIYISSKWMSPQGEYPSSYICNSAAEIL